MRKVIESTLMSIDGVIGDPQVWASEYFGTEAEQAALEQLLDSDAMLMGRRTYEMFAAMSLTATGGYADRMNSIRKYVFSSTLEKADWNNTTIISGDPATAVAGLKQHDGQPLVMYGHGPLGQTLLGHQLLDELPCVREAGATPRSRGTRKPRSAPPRTQPPAQGVLLPPARPGPACAAPPALEPERPHRGGRLTPAIGMRRWVVAMGAWGGGR